MGYRRPFSFLFLVFFQTYINTILQKINVNKCPSSIRHLDSNPRPSEREFPHITTRPELPPLKSIRKVTEMLSNTECASWKSFLPGSILFQPNAR